MVHQHQRLRSPPWWSQEGERFQDALARAQTTGPRQLVHVSQLSPPAKSAHIHPLSQNQISLHPKIAYIQELLPCSGLPCYSPGIVFSSSDLNTHPQPPVPTHLSLSNFRCRSSRNSQAFIPGPGPPPLLYRVSLTC